MEMKVMVMDCF